jgi:hypothetical protein
MSTFPTGRPGNGQGQVDYQCEAVRDAGGVLVQPIGGQIYLIEESDLEALTPARLAGLASRH